MHQQLASEPELELSLVSVEELLESSSEEDDVEPFFFFFFLPFVLFLDFLFFLSPFFFFSSSYHWHHRRLCQLLQTTGLSQGPLFLPGNQCPIPNIAWWPRFTHTGVVTCLCRMTLLFLKFSQQNNKLLFLLVSIQVCFPSPKYNWTNYQQNLKDGFDLGSQWTLPNKTFTNYFVSPEPIKVLKCSCLYSMCFILLAD